MFSYLFNYVNCAGCVKSFLQFFFLLFLALHCLHLASIFVYVNKIVGFFWAVLLHCFIKENKSFPLLWTWFIMKHAFYRARQQAYSKRWRSHTPVTVSVLFVGIAHQDFITAYRAVKDVRVSSSELSKNNYITHAWKACHARLTRIIG